VLSSELHHTDGSEYLETLEMTWAAHHIRPQAGHIYYKQRVAPNWHVTCSIPNGKLEKQEAGARDSDIVQNLCVCTRYHSVTAASRLHTACCGGATYDIGVAVR
jgi:hypothetical protein